ncbi:hypothetical protein ACFQE0_14785 [Methylobacterium komagatae]|uniref:Uncharacterized protein n=1 Tax=Methylobacterium komagatae TaxID=374425 RepID=A0ABW2BMZ1_9HYPH
MSDWKDRQRIAGSMDLTLFCVHGAAMGLKRARRDLEVGVLQAASPREERALLKLASDAEDVERRVTAAMYRMGTRRRAKLGTKVEA